MYRGDKVKRSSEAVSSILSAETLVAWSYEQPCSLEGATYEELTALMADADFVDAPAVQALAEQKLVGHSLMQTNPLLLAEFVPFAQSTLIRALRKLTAEKRDMLLLEERYPKRLVDLDAFVKNIKARNEMLIALQTRFDEASSVS